jgi:hypothetical protein
LHGIAPERWKSGVGNMKGVAPSSVEFRVIAAAS